MSPESSCDSIREDLIRLEYKVWDLLTGPTEIAIFSNSHFGNVPSIRGIDPDSWRIGNEFKHSTNDCASANRRRPDNFKWSKINEEIDHQSLSYQASPAEVYNVPSSSLGLSGRCGVIVKLTDCLPFSGRSHHFVNEKNEDPGKEIIPLARNGYLLSISTFSCGYAI